MKHYEVIKRMNVDEMTAVFFMFAMGLWQGEKTKEFQQELWKTVNEFLNKEVEENGVTGSQTQPK